MEDEKSKKIFLMKVGIVSVMVLILVFWILNIKNVLHNNKLADEGQSAQKWQEIKDDLNQATNKMSESLDEIKVIDERAKTASSSLIEEFIKETDKAASSTESMEISASSAEPIPVYIPKLPLALISTSSSSSEPSPAKESTCPKYVNCMPTIGEAPACYVSPACEGITEKVY